MAVYKKICKNPKCNKDFESESRNTRYCSTECCATAQIINKKKDKKCSKRRKRVPGGPCFTTFTIKDLCSLSRDVADAVLQKKCQMSLRDPSHVCSGNLELHHKDANPFNISISNMEYLCRTAHEEEQQKLPNLSMVSILREAALQENPGAVFNEYVYEQEVV